MIDRRELAALGATDKAIRHRVDAGRLHRLHHGVYSIVPQSLLTQRGRWLAAVRAAGPVAVLSHGSAAALWELRYDPSGPVHVTIPRGGSRSQAGIRVHRARSLGESDVTDRHGVPCTSVARTLLDFASDHHARDLERMLDQAHHNRVLDFEAVDEVIRRAGGRRGAGTLRALWGTDTRDPPLLRSELERRFLDLVRGAGLPEPVVNGVVEELEVDFHWPEARLVVEVDGRATHESPLAFERDRRRDLTLRLAGWDVLRFTWRQVTSDPAPVQSLVGARLRGRA